MRVTYKAPRFVNAVKKRVDKVYREGASALGSALTPKRLQNATKRQPGENKGVFWASLGVQCG